MTRDAARRALRTPKVLAALARRAVADADSADAFVIENAIDADEDKHGYEDGKRCCLLPPSVNTASVMEDAFRVSFAVGYQGDALRVAPEILERDPSAWTAAPFEPVGLVSKNGKHVCSIVIAPSGADANAALETVVEIRAQYEQMRLGTMEAGARRDTASNKHDALPAFSMTTPFSRSETNASEQTLPEEVFAYDPETNGSFDAALARLVSVANAVTHTGPFLVYLTGPSAAAREDEKKARRLATYAAARVAELADEDATTRCDFDFVVIPSDRLGRRRCTPAFARERATSAFCVAARRERKSTFGEKAPSEAPSRGVFEIARSREPLVTVSRRFQKRLEDEPNYEPNSNESRFQNRDDDDCDVTSATLCAYAFVTTEEDRGELVVALTDETGETFSVETTYASSVSSNGREWLKRPNADATPSSDGVATTHANLADWLVSRTLAFTAARAAAAGDAYASSFTNARAAKRARVFFGAQAPRVAADEAPVFCAVGAGVVVTEVVPANQESGDRAFANVLRSAFIRERRLVNEKRRKDGVGSAKPTDDVRVLLGETRLGFLRAEDEDERFSERVASLRADGSVATHAGGRRARDGRVAAIATRVAPVADVAEKKKTEPARDSSRVAFAFASLARAARAVRGVDRGERTRVRDVAPPHVAACASLAATLRDLERIAAGRGE